MWERTGRKQTKPGRLWVFVGDRDHPHTVYDYTPTKARDGPAAILQDYRGFLQADAANVFDGIYRPGAIVEVGCWAHARRLSAAELRVNVPPPRTLALQVSLLLCHGEVSGRNLRVVIGVGTGNTNGF